MDGKDKKTTKTTNMFSDTVEIRSHVESKAY